MPQIEKNMHYKLTIAALAILFAMSGCGQSENQNSEGAASETTSSDVEVIETESGLKVEIYQKGDGNKPSKGDIVLVHYTGMQLASGDTFDSSVERGEPIKFPLGVGRVIKGWDEGIALLSKGAKAKLTIPAKLGYGNRAIGVIPPNSDLLFDVELFDFQPGPTPIEHTVYETEGAEKISLPSGLEIYLIEKGEGPQVQPGQQVSVHYYGYLRSNGEKFDESFARGEPFTFTLGRGEVIQGWEEGIAQLGVGDKAKIVIPYNLAYGEQGRPPVIPERADLVFDVEIMAAQ
ncbi:MAG: FKBP-type peptidyl-prolyl cis-trans isomerase [Salibacteraceae bacterium]